VIRLVLFLVLLLGASPARAHGMRTAYVDIRETPEGGVVVQVRSGASYGALRVTIDGCDPETWRCTRSLRGATVGVQGLGAVVSDAVVAVTLRDGTTVSQLLRPGASSWTIPQAGTSFLAFVRAGFLHVLAGADHLLFLAALVVALRGWRAVLLAETAFTVSHSIAFTATALGWIQVPSAAAEAAIALSLVLLAIDVGRQPMKPWAGARLALGFGAVHGLGFAGGLAELGVPRDAALPALLGFAGGVEIAQVIFLLACVLVCAAAERLTMRRALDVATTYAVGVTGSFWFFARAIPLL
jgi:hypothetical protein